MGKFHDKVVLITGASSGIGAAVAVAFAQEGAKLAITGRNEQRLKETAVLCQKAGAEVLEIIVDFTAFQTLEQTVEKTVEKFSRIDILVNNAGLNQVGSIEALTLEKYEKMFVANVRAPIFLCKYALPYLKMTKGCVVNVSSVGSMVAKPGFIPYCMTKSALDQFTRGFAAECAPFGIRVNGICPGAVNTPIFERLGIPPGLAAKAKEDLIIQQPFGFMEPDVIAESILFLASATCITGISLPVDAGYMLAS